MSGPQVCFFHLKVARGDKPDQACIQVDRRYRSFRADSLAEPLSHATVAAADFQAPPATVYTEPGEVSSSPRIQDLGHQVEPLVLDDRVVAQDIPLHRAPL